MADDSPPSKRQKTEGDGFMLQLENQLPDELMAGMVGGGPPVNSGQHPSMGRTPLSQSQPSSSAVATSAMAQHPMPHPNNVQNHKKFTQLLQSGSHNSPNFANTPSPGSNNAINSPRPPRQPSQPSPLSTAHNSLQSPSAGSMALMNSMKSPSSLPRPNSRPNSTANATASPRPGSIPGGPLSVGSNQSVPGSVGMSMCSPIMPVQQPMNVMQGGMQKFNTMNGPTRQVPGMMQQVPGGGIMRSMPNSIDSNMNQVQKQPPVMQMQNDHFNPMQQQQQQQQMQAPTMMSQVGGMHANPMGMNDGMNAAGMVNANNINMQRMQANKNAIGMDKPENNMQFGGIRPGLQSVQNLNNMKPTNQHQMQRLPNQVDPQSQGMDVNMGPMMGSTNQGHLQQQMQVMPQSVGQPNQMQQVPHGNMAPGAPKPMGQMPGAAAGQSNPTAPADPEKRRLIQQQLVLLLHAYKCAKKEQSGESPNCTLPHCRTMKEVLRHMNVCTQGKSCQVAHCASSRQIIAHWRACNRHDCVVCLPLKSVPNNNNNMNTGAQASLKRFQNVSQPSTSSIASTNGAAPQYPQINDHVLNTVMLPPDNSMSNLPNGFSTAQVTNMSQMGGVSQVTDSSGNLFHASRVEREWHKDVTEELRNHLVQKLVQAIFPTPQKVSLTDERMKKLVTFARKVEGDMYEQAKSRSEYYHLLAEKIYKIQKELEEKRAIRNRRVGPMNNQRMDLNGSVPPIVNPVMQNPMQRNMTTEQFLNVGAGKMPVSNVGGPQVGDLIQMNQQPMMGNATGPENLDNMLLNPAQSSMQQPLPETIMKFKLAQDEIRQQRKQTPPPSMLDNQGQGMSNLRQMTNDLDNNMGGSQIPSSMGPMSDQQNANPKFGNMGQVDPMNQEMPAHSKTYTSQPKLESLLRGTANSPASLADSTSSMNTSVSMTPSNYFPGSVMQNAFESKMGGGGTSDMQHRMGQPQMGKQGMFKTENATSLQEILQGPVSNSITTSTTTTTIASSMEVTRSSNSSTMTSPTPFVNQPKMSIGEEMKNQSGKAMNSSSSQPSSEVQVKTEPISMMDGGKPMHQPGSQSSAAQSTWSTTGPVSSVKMEVQNEKESESTPSSSTALTPFVKQESVSSNASTPASSKTPCQKKVFDPLELKIALLPVVEKLYKQDPEALPFRQPVDPEKLNIPDYFDIIKQPMDLASIRKNLETGKYKEPWEFMADIWLMFNNAWLYNRRTTRVYKYCSKLKEIFEAEIDPVMQSLGYCCGRKMEFMPMTLCCYGKQLCTIPTGATYYEYQNRYDYCEKCFNEIPGDSISLADDPGKPQSSVTTIPKSQFEKKKNDVLDPEPFETCIECGRKMHKICVLHMSPIWPEGFTCDKCHSQRNTQRKANRYVAKKLSQNKLGEHIEQRVNNYIKRHDTNGEAGHVNIRVVYSGDKTVEVRSGMKARFVDTKEMPETFPYHAKAFFAFEEIDGVDVCFFGVHVQEYGSDSPRPNQRRVYLSYLDSVHFFRPRHLRTAVYHEILIGYFEYCKMLGYEFAHIWACPPCEGDDYIFHCHPPEQKIPKPKRLQDWYKKMLDKAISEQVIVDYKDIFHQAKVDRLQSARELPYFEGDFWPNVLEESIKEIEQEEEDRKKAEANEQAAAEESDQGSQCSSKNGKNKNKSKKANSKKASQRTAKKKLPQIANDLTDKLYQTMEKHKEVFFVIRLNSVETISKMGPTVDPDPHIQCELMDGRDAFLTLAREKHYEFSSLRRAKWSTMAMLVELHTQGQDKFSYMCNNCRNNVETRYQCTVCHDFDLCVNCYNLIGHEHKMEKMGFGLDDGSGPAGVGSSNARSSHIPVEKCMQSLVHACQCRNANCNQAACMKMKKVVHHAKNCKKKTNGTCPICKQLIALCCYHAKHCQEKKCPVAFCHNIKMKLKQQELQHKVQQAYLMRRRMALMNRDTSTATAPSTPVQSQNSPKHQITPDHMSKPQASPMTNIGQDRKKIRAPSQQMPGMDMSGGDTMASPQTNMVPMQGANQHQVQPMLSPQMTANQQNQGYVNRGNMGTSGMVNQQQRQIMSPGMVVGQPDQGLMSPSQQQPGNFQPNKYPSPPPEAAVRAAKHAQQLADQQAREKLATYIHNPTPNPNPVMNRPVNSGMPRPMVPQNPGFMHQIPQPHRAPMRPMVTSHVQPIGGMQRPVNPINQVATNSSMNTATPNNQPTGWKQVLQLLKRDSNQPGGSAGRGQRMRSSEQLMNLLKTNPNLMSTIIRQKRIQQQNKQQNQQKIVMGQQHPGQMVGNSTGNVQGNMGGVQQIVMQNTVNQPTMNMNPPQGGMGNATMQMQWHHQNRRLQQTQFQNPAPPYPQQAMNQQRVMNMRFQPQQHRMQTPRHQGPVQGNVGMQQGMLGQPVSNVQGVQSLQLHSGMMNQGSVSQVGNGMMGQPLPSSQAMPGGRVPNNMQQHPMPGRTTPLGPGQVVNQGTTMAHMVNAVDQQYNQNVMQGGFNRNGNPNMNSHMGQDPFNANNVNQDVVGTLGNPMSGQDALDHFDKSEQ